MNVMDLSPIINDFETPFLVNSDTESPGDEEGSEHSEDSTVGDIESSANKSDKLQFHILDKEVSVDEEVLALPLEPIRAVCVPICVSVGASRGSANIPGESGDAGARRTPSILRRESSLSSVAFRKVSFPTKEAELVHYKDPEFHFQWAITSYLPPEKILQIYQSSCKHHKSIELDIIKNLILDIKNNTNHSAILNLSTLNITNEVNETLEDLLKIANFRTLVLNECKFTSDTISEFLNMVEYYEAVREIEVDTNFEDLEAWKCFCQACTNIAILEAVSFKNMQIDDTYMRMLLHSVKSNSQITILKFDTCVKFPTFYLVENLMNNTTLCELYLPSTGLYTKEADCLGRFLQKNFTLKVLDISNNCIGDRGLEVLAKGLTRQNVAGCGLSVLLIFNNQITEKSGPIISNIIIECKNLHTLNVGYNNLTDEVIDCIKSSLEVTTSLEGLGLQCTLLTCKGIDFLSSAIENNNSLQKINLKGNKAIQVPGLERLCQALTASKISKIEIDETNRSASNPQAYVQLVKKMIAICTVNKSFKESSTDEITNISQLVSRKVSLSCEPRYIISDMTIGQGEALAPPQRTKSRFSITKVQDPHPRPLQSRFKVTPVLASPEEDPTDTKFANVRSSVSSLDTDSDGH